MKEYFKFYNGYLKKRRILGIVLAIFYAIVYDCVVRNYLSKIFGYLLDYTYNPMSFGEYLTYVIVCTIPMIFYRGFKYIAAIFSYFCYLLVYVPFIHTLYVANYPIEITIYYITVFFIAQCMFFITDNIKLGKKNFSSKKIITFRQFEIIVGVLFLIAVIININKIHFVNIFSSDQRELLYDLREENNSSSGVFNNYISTWLNHILIPILMVCYLKNKKITKLCLSFSAMIVMFMIDMQKISFLIPFVIVIFFYIYKFHPKGYLENFHIMFFIVLIIIPLYLINNLSNPIAFTIAAILIMRTQCVEGRELATYFNFFEIHDNPVTAYTHINFINKLTGLYPYEESLGYTVSYGEGNSNANFFLMDGIAAGGLLGCIIASIAFIIFKSYFNTIGNNLDKGLCIIILLFPISSLMNVSIFTSLLTGGFLLFYLICKTVDLKTLSNHSILKTHEKKSYITIR